MSLKVNYSIEEREIWQFLINQQIEIAQCFACDAYLAGIKILKFPKQYIPQCSEISKKLLRKTGWSIVPASALVADREFFALLAERKFPATTFIRRWDEIGHLKEPDVFHEFFGHCPMLAEPCFTEFLQFLGKTAARLNPDEMHYLGRLCWFTFETGLIKSSNKIKIYGGAILSSKDEIHHCFNNASVIYKPFNLMEVLCTPYRYDVLQPTYFFIQDFSELYQLIEIDLLDKIREAQANQWSTGPSI